MREKKRTCPRCGHRQVVSLPKCTECGLKYSKLENATHTEAMKAFKEKDKARVVYVNDLPSDLNMVKFIISLVFGFFGATSFYVGKKARGWFSLISFLCLFISMYAQTEMIEAGMDTQLFNYFVTTTFGLLCAVSFLLWADDIIRAITRRFRFPVALPSVKPHEKMNIRQELYEEIMKEKEEINHEGAVENDEDNSTETDDEIKVEQKVKNKNNNQKNKNKKKKHKKGSKKHKKSNKK